MVMRDLRDLLARQLDWEDAHVGYRRAVADFPAELRAVMPVGFAHSGWQLLEHLRLAQVDILRFCVDPGYIEPASMDEYWPAGPAPTDEAAWDASIARFREDMHSLQALALDEAVDLSAPVQRGDGQTFLRELFLVTDHNAYHVGQFVALRRVLGCWRDRPSR